MTDLTIVRIPALSDNYIWLVHDPVSEETVVIDPAEAAPVLAEAEKRGWRIGQKDKNNGVVLVIAPKDHELRIETGYGAEGPLPDATADAIIRHVIVPHFKQNDYSGGISAGIASIEAALEGSFSAPADSQSTQANSAAAWPWPAFLIALLWLVIVLFNVLRRAGQGGTRLYTRQRRGPPYWGGGFGGGGFGGGGFGGGGFGGGGGTGGGGGASGSW